MKNETEQRNKLALYEWKSYTSMRNWCTRQVSLNFVIFFLYGPIDFVDSEVHNKQGNTRNIREVIILWGSYCLARSTPTGIWEAVLKIELHVVMRKLDRTPYEFVS